MFRNRLAEIYAKLDKARADHIEYLQSMLMQSETRRAEEIIALRAQHAEEIARRESLALDYECAMLRRIEELKSAHAVEAERAITENQRLRDDVERMRILATPALQHVEVNPDRSAPPAPQQEVYRGTPWQRIQARELAKQQEAAAHRRVQPAEATANDEGGTSNGGKSDGRVHAPLGGPSETA